MDLSNVANVSSKYVESLSLYYCHVTSQVITPDGKLLLAAIKGGRLAVFPVRNYLKDIYLSTSETPSDGEPIANTGKRFKSISLLPIGNSLCLQLDNQQNSSQYKFVAAGQGSVKGYTLSVPNQLEEGWTITLPSDNTLANVISLKDGKIYSGCSDNNIYVHDKETLQEVSKLTGHQDYLHSLKVTDDQQLFSASEDGSVRSWDLRVPGEPTSVILPFKKTSLDRPHFGKWIGALDVSPSGEWLVCGGGPKLSMWHLRSRKFVHAIDSPNVTHVAQFLPADSSAVIFAGNGNHVSTWQMSNDSPYNTKISSSIDNVYSIEHYNYVDYDFNLSSFSGDSFKLELCKNAKYIDTELYVS